MPTINHNTVLAPRYFKSFSNLIGTAEKLIPPQRQRLHIENHDWLHAMSFNPLFPVETFTKKSVGEKKVS